MELSKSTCFGRGSPGRRAVATRQVDVCKTRRQNAVMVTALTKMTQRGGDRGASDVFFRTGQSSLNIFWGRGMGHLVHDYPFS